MNTQELANTAIAELKDQVQEGSFFILASKLLKEKVITCYGIRGDSFTFETKGMKFYTEKGKGIFVPK